MMTLPRGLGELQRFVVTYTALDRGGGETRVVDLAADWVHGSMSGGRRERCDCPGRCLLLTETRLNAVRRACRSLEAKGLVVLRHDWFGRSVVRAAEGVPTWRPGQHGPHRGSDPGLCRECGQPVDLLAS